MKPATTSGDPVQRRTALGFSIILLLSWLSESLHLPHLLFDDPFEFSWTRVLLRSAIIVAVWSWVHLSNRRLLRRLHQLEEFLLICSWCRKVGHEGRWLTMEEYFGSNFDTETSHGICPACAQQQREAHRAATRVPPPAGPAVP
ncbi:MAG: hypothetical protein JNG83_13375 [Opitutaceae bacterium]|nr:hypothetical protein [Opitutaceae bacterium]